MIGNVFNPQINVHQTPAKTEDYAVPLMVHARVLKTSLVNFVRVRNLGHVLQLIFAGRLNTNV